MTASLSKEPRREGAAGHDRASATAVVIPTGRNAVATIRSLGSRGIYTIMASERPNSSGFCSRYRDEAIVTPSPDTNLSGYRDALLSLAARPDVLTIAPLREVDIFVLSKYASAFEEHVVTPWVPFDTLQNVHDRYRLAEFAAETGVSVPRTQLFDEVDDWTPRQVVKPRYSVLTGAYVESLSRDEGARQQAIRYLEPDAEPDRDSIVAEMGHVPIVQEYVPVANEYGFGAICDRGEPLATFQHQKHRDHRYSGGASVFRESVRVPEIEEAGRTLLKELDWHGMAQIQFMEDADTGEFKLTEINPRFWGSVSCAVRAGADFPYYYWLLSTNQQDRIAPGYDVGVATHDLIGEVSYLLSILQEDDNQLVEKPSLTRASLAIVVSIVAHPRFDFFRADDPTPFFCQFRIALAEGLDRLSQAFPLNR